jgi:STAM-binding protein
LLFFTSTLLTLVQARIYEREGNDQQTYLLLFRHAILVLEKLSQHPEAREPQNRIALAAANKVVSSDLEKLEVLKPRIETRYAIYQEHVARQRTQHAALQRREGEPDMGGLVDGMGRASLRPGHRSDMASFDHKTSLDAGENQNLVAQLAQREIRRRDTARRAVRQAGVSEEEEQERRTGGLWNDWESGLNRPSAPREESDLARDIVEAGRWRESVQNGHRQVSSSYVIINIKLFVLTSCTASTLGALSTALVCLSVPDCSKRKLSVPVVR